jgi:hypothetical protein
MTERGLVVEAIPGLAGGLAGLTEQDARCGSVLRAGRCDPHDLMTPVDYPTAPDCGGVSSADRA